MNQRKKYLPLLLLGIISLLGLLFYIFFINPTQAFPIGNFFVSPVIFFFVLLLATIACVVAFILKNVRRGILSGIFITAILLLRFLGFSSYIYIIILVLIILLLELGFRQR